MTPYPRTVEQIAYELQGSCDSLCAVLERHEMEGAEHDSTFCYQLDSLVFECLGCGWWFEISEMSDDPAHDWKCEDCAGE